MDITFFDLQITIPRSETALGSLYVLSGVLTNDGVGKILDDPEDFVRRFRALRKDCGDSIGLTEADEDLFITGYVCEASDPESLRKAADNFSKLCSEYLGLSARIVTSARPARLLQVRMPG